MKNNMISLTALCLAALMLLCSCGKSDAAIDGTTAAGTTAGTAAAGDTTAAGNDTSAIPAIADEPDVDLSALSSTMVYSEVYNMVNTPDKYIGKTIKMDGVFNANYFDGTQKYYYYVIIADATACCQQGIEIVWNGEHKYPDDFPENGANVSVTGVFGTYTELDVKYNCLFVDDITAK